MEEKGTPRRGLFAAGWKAATGLRNGGAAGFVAALLMAPVASAGAAANPPPADPTPIVLPAPRPVSPQPDPSKLKQGLGVRYYFNRFNELRELEDWMQTDEGQPGPPLSQLDYRSGIGNVLTAGTADMVGARIDGFLHLAAAGKYRFLVTSNDGVRLSIGGVKMHEDPSIHGDTTSRPLVFEVAEPGWYPLHILYFEKKGTATLVLYWRPPGGESDEPVPAAILRHP
jgi:hypothetical protein